MNESTGVWIYIVVVCTGVFLYSYFSEEVDPEIEAKGYLALVFWPVLLIAVPIALVGWIPLAIGKYFKKRKLKRGTL